jgi:TIR domain-containing protein
MFGGSENPVRFLRTVSMHGEVFINYRGTDSRSYGALLYVELSRRFGPELVFLDSESLPAGTDFAEQLLGQARQARAMLAVIGPGWLAPTRSRWLGRLRCKGSTDWTRRELAEAFAAGVKVIPVLTDDAELPTERELPACLAPLSRCQYRRLRCRDAMADLDRIVNDLIAADPDLADAARRRSATVPQPVAAAQQPPAAPRPHRAVTGPRPVAPHRPARRGRHRTAGGRNGY